MVTGLLMMMMWGFLLTTRRVVEVELCYSTGVPEHHTSKRIIRTRARSIATKQRTRESCDRSRTAAHVVKSTGR